jgi:transcriptional regulator of acetoin/glycerol metabolism
LQIAPASPTLTPSAAELGYQEARASFEQAYLKGLLAAAGGNVSEAARLSGIPRQNLYVRMKRWGFVTDS